MGTEKQKVTKDKKIASPALKKPPRTKKMFHENDKECHLGAGNKQEPVTRHKQALPKGLEFHS